MDEEDLADLRSNEKIVTSSSLRLHSSVQSEGTMLYTAMPIKSTVESSGYALLRQMGWKPGFGIGPLTETLIEGRKVMMPPRQTASFVQLETKQDKHGLGLHSASGQLDLQSESMPQDLLSSSALPAASSLRKKKNSGMGSGVLLDFDDNEEDEDPYEIKPVLYDKSLGPKKASKKLQIKQISASARKGKLTFASSVSLPKTVRLCVDGRPPLSGFTLSSSPPITAWSNLIERYRPPAIPTTFISGILIMKDPRTHVTPKMIAEFRSQHLHANTLAAMVSTSERNVELPQLDISSRSKLLGESANKGKSVFDFLTPEQRDKIVSLTGNTSLPPAKSETLLAASSSDKPPADDGAILKLIPSVGRETVLSALSKSAFMPYSDIPAKRTRYKTYLEAHAGIVSLDKILLPLKENQREGRSGLSMDEWLTELREFKKSAELFKPLSGMLANRFTSSSSTSGSKPSAADSTIDDEDVIILGAGGEKSASNISLNDDKKRAAELGMYGPLTRSAHLWSPSRLLCKRFGISPPLTVSGDLQSETKHETSAREWDSIGSRAAPVTDLVSDTVLKDLAKGADIKVDLVENRFKSSDIRPEENEALEQPRAPADLFAAVFGD